MQTVASEAPQKPQYRKSKHVHVAPASGRGVGERHLVFRFPPSHTCRGFVHLEYCHESQVNTTLPSNSITMSDPSKIHTYHCLCSTLLLATPYQLSTLPRRAPPSLDRAYILPLPPLSRAQIDGGEADAHTHTNINTSTNTHASIPAPTNLSTLSIHDSASAEDGENITHDYDDGVPLPSLLTPNLRPARKVMVVRREDGFEKRRLYRCGRCGVGVGYEVLREEEGGEGRGRKVLFLMEGGLVETGEMGGEDGA